MYLDTLYLNAYIIYESKEKKTPHNLEGGNNKVPIWVYLTHQEQA